MTSIRRSKNKAPEHIRGQRYVFFPINTCKGKKNTFHAPNRTHLCKKTETLSMPFYHVTRGERLLYVYQSLVGRTSEKEARITQGLNEGTVNKDIQILQQRHDCRVVLGQ